MSKRLNIENWPIVKAAQIAAVYSFSDDDLRVTYRVDDSTKPDQLSIVSYCIELWRHLAHPFGVCHLVLNVDDQTYVVSRHGNLAFHGRGSVNLGLLFRSLAELPMMSSHPSREQPDFKDVGDAILWQVLSRLARCETPRQLTFEIGQQTVVCDADATGFRIVSGVADFDAFVSLLRQETASGNVMRYTLGQGQVHGAPLAAVEVIRAITNHEIAVLDRWEVLAGHWPKVVPLDAKLDQLQAVMQSARCVTLPALHGKLLSFRGYDKDRALRVSYDATSEGEFIINLPPGNQKP